MSFVGNLVFFQWRKNFENWLRFDEVTAVNLVASFYSSMLQCCTVY